MTARFERVVIDVGTGTGQAVLRAARRTPETLFIGVDPDVAALREASHSAARPARRGGLPNVAYLAESAESLPGPLAGRADLVTVALPWGSLLHGLLNADTGAVARLSALLKQRGELEILLSTTPTDQLPVQLRDQSAADKLARALESADLSIAHVGQATREDVARLSSAWGKRLGIPDRRAGWLFRFERNAATPDRAERRPHVPWYTRRAAEPVPLDVRDATRHEC